jgi:pilus assembly protein FimV
MHLRKLILVSGFACLFLSNAVLALGLGEVTLNSKLNEPLNAEIKLLDARGLSVDQIIVSLASPADFERNGIDRLYFLTEFDFEVMLNHSGGPAVRITSRTSVREPFVNFLVEARWPTGRLLREYTLLMDLPTFSEASASSAVQAATARSMPSAAPAAASRAESRPRPASAPSAASSSPTQSRAAITGDSYSVGANDTLWQIALDSRPDNSHSVHQTMLAIQRLNPDAFINGNINLLRKGQVLRIPSSDEIRSVAQREAVNEVVRQNQAWSNDDLGAQLSASRRDNSPRREADSVSGSVRLATPSNFDSSSGQGSGDNSGRGRALESELAASLEELDKTRSENQELSSRVRDLESQIETMERLVDVSNEQLRALQLTAAQSDNDSADAEAAEQYPVPNELVPGDVSDVNEQADSLASDDAPTNASNDVASIEPAPVVAESAPAQINRTVVPPRPAKTLIDQVMENLLWIVAVVVGLIALIAFILYRRRQNAADNETLDDDVFAIDSHETGDELDHEAAHLIEDPDEVPAFDEDELPAEAETGDVVGEADIYIAYGKFDQAEEMLLNGLAKDPNSIDIRMKLLEVYSQTQDASKFDRYYAGLIGLAGQPALARAAELREHIAGAGEFESSPATVYASDSIDISTADDAIDLDDTDATFDSNDFGADEDLEFNLALDDDQEAEEDENFTSAAELNSGATRYDLSFDEPAPAIQKTGEEEFSFDFDLDDSPSVPTDASVASSEIDDELSFELDDTDEVMPVAEPVTDLDQDDDVSFDFDDALGDSPRVVEQDISLFEEEVTATTISEEESEEELEADLQLPDDTVDDFNLDMAMDELDLAALDEEMESLEADFVDAEDVEDTEVVALDDQEETDSYAVELEGEDEPDFVIEPETLTQPAASELTEIESRDDEDDVFDQVLSGIDSGDDSAAELADLSDDDMDAELDFLADADEAATKLDLARAYIDMGDTDGARDILAEVAHEGNEEQRQEAVDLLSRIDV